MSHILIVDDEKPILSSVGDVLRDEGYEVSTAETGMDALKFMKENTRPDLVLLDVWMPGMDGLEALTRMQENYPGTVARARRRARCSRSSVAN